MAYLKRQAISDMGTEEEFKFFLRQAAKATIVVSFAPSVVLYTILLVGILPTYPEWQLEAVKHGPLHHSALWGGVFMLPVVLSFGLAFGTGVIVFIQSIRSRSWRLFLQGALLFTAQAGLFVAMFIQVGWIVD